MHPTLTPPTILEATPTATVAVSALCEFTAKHGDLDFRFTPSPSAQEGIAGHQAVTARRIAANPQYQREVALNGDHFGLRVRGRADGYDPQAQRLDEIKTHRGNLARMPANHRHLHWAQAKVYAHMQCDLLGLVSIKVALVYFEVITGDETVLCEEHSALDLQAFFTALCAQYASWAAQEAAHRLARDLMLTKLAFPHEAFRVGQRPLSEAVYKANLSGRCLLAQAPTGIGKTMGVLYPALKAAPTQKIDKVLFLTAKTPGRALAVRAFEKLHFSAASSTQTVPLRLLELVAKDKACEHPGSACHGDSCPLAKGFYDRLPAARLAAVNVSQALDKTALRELAQQHAVCPYYLAQALVRWADVIVGDYNHYFDLTAQLYGATLNEDWRVSVLVDEAHNLVSRGRQMYSAELEYSALRAAQQGAPSSLKKPLAQLQRQWQALLRDQTEAYLVHATLPAKLLGALQKLAAEIGAFSAENPDGLAGDLKRFYFDVLLFVRLAELHGAHSLFDVTLADAPQPSASSTPNSTLCLRNVIPAPLLAERFKKAHSVTLFSATLSPQNYLRDLLGLPPNTAWLDVPSAFAPQQLTVQVARHISTRFNDRSASLASVVRIMAQQYAKAPGNYLAFFSSFDYLQQAAKQLSAAHPAIAQWQQSRRMNEPEREAFLARFTPHGRGIGFAVLGGAFGEGIDLPGSRLIGAFIATLGLPQVNPVNEQIKARMQQLFDTADAQTEAESETATETQTGTSTSTSTSSKAYDYTYLYPGLQKVVQAAGRVIRTPEDQGVVFLMDDRYARGEVQRLFPAWWNVL